MSEKEQIQLTVDASGNVVLSGTRGRVTMSADVVREIAAMMSEHRGTVQRGEVLGRLVVAEKVREQPSAGEVPDVE